MSGVSRLRRSHSAPKSMPRVYHALTDVSGLRGTGTRHVEVDADVGSGLAPKKHRAFGSTEGMYPETGTPKSAESNINGEGRIHRHGNAKSVK